MILALKFFFTILLSSLIPQIIKVIRAKAKSEGNIFEALAETGGMPSSHSSVMAATTLLIFLDGGFSPLFFMSFVMMAIVIRDAVGVRYSVGEQAKVLNHLVDMQGKSGKKAKNDVAAEKVKIVKGHKNEEAAVGFFIGIAIALIVYFLF